MLKREDVKKLLPSVKAMQIRKTKDRRKMVRLMLDQDVIQDVNVNVNLSFYRNTLVIPFSFHCQK